MGEQREAQKSRVQESFGKDSAYYRESAPHARSTSLRRAVELIERGLGHVLDVATGAGHTALAVAPKVGTSIASDLTFGMLRTARDLRNERSVGNVPLLRCRAESLPLASASLDAVTVRIAPHHFDSVDEFLDEVARVLQPGGALVYVDNIAPDASATAAAYNDWERLRDPSHVRCASVAELLATIESAGFDLELVETMKKPIDFDNWVNRPHLDEPTRSQLRSQLTTPGELSGWLAPALRDDNLTFLETEAVILARRR